MDGWVCAFIDTYSQRSIISAKLIKLSDQCIHRERKQKLLIYSIIYYSFFRTNSFFIYTVAHHSYLNYTYEMLRHNQNLIPIPILCGENAICQCYSQHRILFVIHYITAAFICANYYRQYCRKHNCPIIWLRSKLSSNHFLMMAICGCILSVFPHTISSTSLTSPLEGAFTSWRNPTIPV